MAAEKKTSELGKPFDVKPSPKAPEKLPTELKKMWTLCMDMKVPFTFDVREINRFGGNSKYREKARVHNRILNDELATARTALRDEKCTRLFLGGRDTWPMAILCAKHHIPFRFVPELSRPVSQRPQACKSFLERIGYQGDELFLDTGFAGSIPKAIQRYFPEYKLRFRLISQTEIVEEQTHLVDVDPGPIGGPFKGVPRKEITRYRRRPNQLLPNRVKAREEALETEYLAKYWRSGTYEPVGELQGFAPTVFKEWQPRQGLRRFSKTDHTFKHFGLFDGTEVVFVGENDTHLCKGMKEWILSLPEINELEVPVEHERVVQYFSDRETIQRAAVLASMIWRGIPYWKAAMSAALDRASSFHTQVKGFVNQAVGNAVANTANLNNFNTLTAVGGGVFTNASVFNVTTTGGTGTATTIYVDQFGNQILSPNTGFAPQVTASSTALTSSMVQQALNAVPVMNQHVGQLAIKQNLAALAAATKQAMLQGPPGPAQLPPSAPWPKDQQPIKPDKIIILAPLPDYDDIPVFVDDSFGFDAAV
jgi:hypothetical protein